MEIIINPSLDERKKSGYYFTQFYCSNCSRPNAMFYSGIDIMIPKGQKIPTGKFICPNCKCKTLSR